jgi:hypothetical protein
MDDGRQVMAKAHIAFGKVSHRQFLFLIVRFLKIFSKNRLAK